MHHAFGETSLQLSAISDRFKNFRFGDFRLDDEARSGRPGVVDENQLKILIESNPRLTTREMGTLLNCSHTTIENHLASLGMVFKLNTWIPHQLTESQLHARADACQVFLSKSRTFNWLDSLITGDEKWVMYVNYTRHREWVHSGEAAQSQPKPDPHGEKVMLSVWWDVKGIVYWELLSDNSTINADVYCTQLEKVSEALQNRRPKNEKVYFLHDNARPYVALKTREKIREFEWEVLAHPPYSPDLAPTDFHLFREMQLRIGEKKFSSRDEIKAWLDNFFESQPPSWYRSGIHSLSEKWIRVYTNEGKYLVE